MAKMLSRCPVCEAALNITELSCGNCQTRVHGSFDSCRFCRIAPEHLAFVETFLRCEGNLSRVEKELNLSYPTVRNRFSAALSALGFGGSPEENREDVPFPVPAMAHPPVVTPLVAPPPVDTAERRRAVLAKLESGAMSAEDAAEALRDLS